MTTKFSFREFGFDFQRLKINSSRSAIYSYKKQNPKQNS